MKKLYISSRIKRLPNGKLVMRRAKGWLKKLDQLADIDDYVPKGHRSLSITASGTAKEFTKLGDKLLGKLDLVDKKSILRESGEAFSKASIKGVAKGTLKSMGKSLKKGVSFGVNGVVKDAKALINAKGAGKIIPGLNIAAGAVEVVQGISKSEKQARKDGLKGQEITASKVGGALVDVGKVAVTTAAIGAAGAALAIVGTPVWGVVVAGMGVGWLVNKVDKDNKFTEKAKGAINSMIKGVSGWFKR
ncbi:hypothetical protein AAFD07_000001 [Enterococcus faecalis]|nr:hypothetical protein FKY80_15070 [Enterococcus faecalis]